MSIGIGCPNCGTDGFAEAFPCPACGHYRMGRLRICRDGALLSVIAVHTTVGRALLRKWVGDADAQFAQNSQYAFVPTEGLGWVIVSHPGCRNPTFVDGSQIEPDRPVQLLSGMSVTVGTSRARVDVEIDRSVIQ
jgi:hypothetical protein